MHARYRTESHQDVVGRFNERFLLSLGPCQACLVLDDELNILPISSHVRNIKKEAPAPAPSEQVSALCSERAISGGCAVCRSRPRRSLPS